MTSDNDLRQAAHINARSIERDAEIDRLRAEVERLKSDRASAEPDWFWRDLDPDDSGDTVEEALRYMPQGVVCHIRSSYIGPSFFAATAPVLDADSDDQEYIRADTEEECRALVRARWKARAALTQEKKAAELGITLENPATALTSQEPRT
jgi:hypothetical protein